MPKEVPKPGYYLGNTVRSVVIHAEPVTVRCIVHSTRIAIELSLTLAMTDGADQKCSSWTVEHAAVEVYLKIQTVSDPDAGSGLARLEHH